MNSNVSVQHTPKPKLETLEYGGVEYQPDRVLPSAENGTDGHVPTSSDEYLSDDEPPPLAPETWQGIYDSDSSDDDSTVASVPDTDQDASNIRYNVKNVNRSVDGWSALVDRGANGGLAGDDTRVVHTLPHRHVDLVGIDNHAVAGLAVVTAGAVMETQRGPIIGLFNQYARMRGGRTIHSCIQLEHYKNVVNEKAPSVSGDKPSITTVEGYVIPITIRDGLAYIKMRPYTDSEFDELPKVHMTNQRTWDPSTLDYAVPNDWSESVDKDTDYFRESLTDEAGNVKAAVDREHDEDNMEQEHEEDNLEQPLPMMQVFLHNLVQDDIHPQFHIDYSQYDDAHPLSVNTKRVTRSQTRKENEQIVGDDDGEDDELLPTIDEDEELTGFNNPAKRVLNPKPRELKPSKKDFAKYSKFFPGMSVETIQRTFEATTQYGTLRGDDTFSMKKQVQSPNPVLNVPRRHEAVATDRIFSGGIPAIDCGATSAQFFYGRISRFRSIYACMYGGKSFSRLLMDEIRRYGAMDKIISDSAREQMNNVSKDVLRTYCVDDFQSEPYNKNQNPGERGWGDSKRKTNHLLNMTGAPGELWLLALEYIIFIQNHTAIPSLGWRTPIEWLLGHTPDITVMLSYVFYQRVYYTTEDKHFPDKTDERVGRFVGISTNVGHSITYKVLTDEGHVIRRAVIRPVKDEGIFRNVRANKGSPDMSSKESQTSENDSKIAKETGSTNGTVTTEPETVYDSDDETYVPDLHIPPLPEVVFSHTDTKPEGNSDMPTIDMVDLLGKTYITDPDENDEQARAKITDIQTTGEKTPDGEELIKWRAKVGDRVFHEITTYNKMLEWVERDQDKDDFYKIDNILGHRKSKNKERPGWEVNVKWASAEVSWEPLTVIFTDDPWTVSVYARKHGLLNTPGWKRCKRYAKNTKTLARAANQAKLKNFRCQPVYKYGQQVPRNYREAMRIDLKNGNTKWADSIEVEFNQLWEYESFKDLGLNAPIPEGYTKIRCHYVFDVKATGKCKSRFCAGGNGTEVPSSSVYSGVVSLQGIRMVTFIAELNDMELWATDIGNAYLESVTSEKVAFVAGPEFGKYAGHTLVILKAQYGLRTSGRQWHNRLFDVLISMGFIPSKAEDDIWMRDKGDHYEYMAVYVDDLLIASRNPQAIIDELSIINKFKLKGTGPVTFHLGCDYFRDEKGTLCFGPKRYIDRMIDSYVQMFGSKPKQNGCSSPLAHGDHPELDTSELLDMTGISNYQSLIGTLQWTITLGRFDVGTAVMTMSGFRVAPRTGHLDRLKRICGFLARMKHGVIRVRTEEPDYSDLPEQDYDWTRSVYGNVKEQVPSDAPRPLGKRVVTTTYVDANLYHDMISGRAVTGVLHFLNQTPISWTSQKQATCETATYGSEFVAAKTAIQQIMAMRLTLRYLGVPVETPSRLFGDNSSVVTSSTVPHSRLSKRHHALSYHYTREVIASGACTFHHVPSGMNASDILSKHWGYQQIWSLLKTILFWQGDTGQLIVDAEQSKLRKGSIKCSVNKESSARDPESRTDNGESAQDTKHAHSSGASA